MREGDYVRWQPLAPGMPDDDLAMESVGPWLVKDMVRGAADDGAMLGPVAAVCDWVEGIPDWVDSPAIIMVGHRLDAPAT